MRILFAITALCLLVLLWAGLAIRRHIRSAARERAEHQRPSAKSLIEVELKHELRTAQAEKGFFGSLSDPQPSRYSSRTRPAVRESAIRAAVTAIPIFEPAALEAVQAARFREPAAESAGHTSVQINEAPAVNEFRKPPVSIHDGKFERLDLAHFNKDMGDLSDPYQIPRATARNRS
ncbi:MAG TPA: hypothetical protein VNU94_01310 [Acidobacteriaceae bacterium]|jgi:hypothetical protein|nr:hypothetical protein [Acidobacteriaceae bacterium]